MKKIIYYISILFTLLITACCNEDLSVLEETTNGEETCKLTFKVAIPQPSVASRSFNDGTSIDITSLCLLIFDEDGLLVGSKLADSFTDPTNVDGVYQGTYEIELAKTDEKRIIHFVANYFTNPNDLPSSGNENSVLTQLNVSGTTDAYWQRMEVNGFKDSNGDGVANDIGTVRLIRNFVAVKMEPAVDGDGKSLIPEGFLQGYVLYNEAKQGTVAPYFRNESGGFANYRTGISYTALTNNISDGGQGYIGVEPVTPTTGRYDNTTPQDTDFTMAEKYTYERSYPSTDNVDNPTFIIMKGLYNEKTYYYRVDIAQNFRYFHLLRNFRYILQITKACEGYTSIQDAINGSSFNHLVDINIKVEEITDGETTLKVTPTDITVVNGTESVTVNYTCTYNGTGTAPTVSVSPAFTPEINENRVIINEISTPSNGSITVTLNTFFTEEGKSNLAGGMERQRFEVRTSNGLTREVRINLIDKINFNPQFLGPNGDGLYEYHYNLPSDLPECMFPLEIYFYEETGSFTPASGEQLSVDLIPDPNNEGRYTWRYKKVMTYQEYTIDSDKKFIAEFKSNGTLSETKAYTMEITNEYAYNGSASLARATVITVSGTQNGTLTWYVNDKNTDQPITVTLNNTNVTWEYTLGENSNFEVRRNGNTLTIKPKSLDEALEETLTITTNDGMDAVVKLLVIEKPKETTVYLTMKYDSFMGTQTITNGTISMSVSDNTITASLGTYSNSSKGWPLTIKNASENTTATITFSYKGYTKTYTKTVKISDLMKGTVKEIIME